jgi:hypothetical protein
LEGDSKLNFEKRWVRCKGSGRKKGFSLYIAGMALALGVKIVSVACRNERPGGRTDVTIGRILDWT